MSVHSPRERLIPKDREPSVTKQLFKPSIFDKVPSGIFIDKEHRDQAFNRIQSSIHRIRELVKKEADLSAINKKNETPLTKALKRISFLAIALLESGADPFLPNAYGETPYSIITHLAHNSQSPYYHEDQKIHYTELMRYFLCRSISRYQVTTIEQYKNAEPSNPEHWLWKEMDPNTRNRAFYNVIRVQNIPLLRYLILKEENPNHTFWFDYTIKNRLNESGKTILQHMVFTVQRSMSQADKENERDLQRIMHKMIKGRARSPRPERPPQSEPIISTTPKIILD